MLAGRHLFVFAVAGLIAPEIESCRRTDRIANPMRQRTVERAE
jgi:hypothetical protein